MAQNFFSRRVYPLALWKIYIIDKYYRNYRIIARRMPVILPVAIFGK